MAVLEVLEGSIPGQILELTEDRTVLGRHPNCQIVLDHEAVSRHHAQILDSHGTYYLEDLRSRNGTLLNGELIEGRRELEDRDEVKICDLLFRFHVHHSESNSSYGQPSSRRVVGGPPEIIPAGRSMPDPFLDDPNELSSIVTSFNVKSSSSLRLAVKPEIKLRAVLTITNALAKNLTVESVLPLILDELFKMFDQADTGFILLKDPLRNKLLVKATKTRRIELAEGGAVRLSTTIIKQAIKTGQAILTADAAGDNRFASSESLSNLQIRSMMCVPLMSKSEEVLGVIQLDANALASPFTQDDLDLLVAVATQAALAIENARLHEEVLRQRDLERELEFATQVQLGFLPNERPRIPHYEFFDYYEAAQSVGGDYFDYVKLPNHKIGMTVGDVAGKGVPAALLMARLSSAARYQLLTQPTAADALSTLNTEIASSGLGYRFITFVLAILDFEANTMTIANAGHLPPMRRKLDGSISHLGIKETGMPLGIAKEQRYEQLEISLEPDDTILFYTDGVTEAMNPNHDLYHKDRLVKYMSNADQQLAEMVRGLVIDVEKFCDGRAQRDDICLVAVQRTSRETQAPVQDDERRVIQPNETPTAEMPELSIQSSAELVLTEPEPEPKPKSKPRKKR
ncbi:MAG: SpoIIE family protein phosphatase [Planctomycetaceae bacterium]